MNELIEITKDTNLAKIVFDGTSEGLGIYVYGEVYVPYSLYSKHEKMIKRMEVDAYGVDGENSTTITTLNRVEKGTLDSFVKDFREVPPSEYIHEELADLLGMVMENDVKRYELTRLLWEIRKVKAEYTKTVPVDKDIVIYNTVINGEKVNLRLPKGTEVTVDKGSSHLEDLVLKFNYLK